MLLPEDIDRAIEVQAKAYKLLLWVAEAIDRRIVSFNRAHDCTTGRDAARQWVEDFHDQFPNDAQPEAALLPEFANYFGAYVTSSFDLVETPGQRFADPCGCSCTLCGYLVNASHLKVKSPAKRDKDKALRVCVDRVERLAMEQGTAIVRRRAEEIASSPEHRRNAAYSAYVESVLERMRGDIGGTHVLSLWRMIAWKPEGSPIKNFKLLAKDVVRAEQELVSVFQR